MMQKKSGSPKRRTKGPAVALRLPKEVLALLHALPRHLVLSPTLFHRLRPTLYRDATAAVSRSA